MTAQVAGSAAGAANFDSLRGRRIGHFHWALPPSGTRESEHPTVRRHAKNNIVRGSSRLGSGRSLVSVVAAGGVSPAGGDNRLVSRRRGVHNQLSPALGVKDNASRAHHGLFGGGKWMASLGAGYGCPAGALTFAPLRMTSP